MIHLPYDLGSFIIDRRIDAGGMATVYAGRQKPPINQPVAIKIMHPHIAENPVAVERFEREAANCARVHLHCRENTPEVYGYGVIEPEGEPRLPYLVMELVDGYDLKTWIYGKTAKRGPGAAPPIPPRGKLPLEVALLVIRDVAFALKQAHGCGVIHRDLKPSNVMLTRDGHVKLMDFGLARANDDKQLTDAGAQLGSAPYMSPEQTRGQELTGTEGERSDIFSMGTFSYELLAGVAPFQGKGLADVIAAVANHEPSPIASNPQVPRRLAETIDLAMRKRPAERCASMTEFLESVETAVRQASIDGARLLARYMKQPEQTARELQRDRRARFEKHQERVAPAPERVAPADRLRRRIRVAVVALVAVLLVAVGVGWNAVHRTTRHEPVQLEIDSTPTGATMRLNGEASGVTPRTIVGLPGDSVYIQLTKTDFQPHEKRLTLKAGMPPLRVSLVPILSRTYSISTSPGNADVYLDDSSDPLAWPMRATLKAGMHRFLVKHNGGEREFSYEVRAGDTARTIVLHYDTGTREAK